MLSLRAALACPRRQILLSRCWPSLTSSLPTSSVTARPLRGPNEQHANLSSSSSAVDTVGVGCPGNSSRALPLLSRQLRTPSRLLTVAVVPGVRKERLSSSTLSSLPQQRALSTLSRHARPIQRQWANQGICTAAARSSSTMTPPPPRRPPTTPSAAAAALSPSSASSTNFRPTSFSTSPSPSGAALASASSRSAQLARHLSTTAQPTTTMASPQFTTRKVAAPNTLEHRVYIEKDGVPVSPFHDVPLYADQEKGILNMVVEIPRWTNAKLEISKDELLNPIKQDIKKGKLRYVRNCFPHKGYLWNYGAFPQTWEDPNTIHPETKAKGDNDPLDVCEIGELVGHVGQIKQVKVLGVMALLDEEETDWKVIVVDVNDPLASKLNDVEDVEKHLPGLLRATNEWFRIYKIPDGKPENQFAFTGECKNRAYAMDVVRECAEAWEKLITGKTQPGGISTTNLNVAHSPSRVDAGQLPPLPPNEELQPAKIDSSIDKWFFISGAAA